MKWILILEIDFRDREFYFSTFDFKNLNKTFREFVFLIYSQIFHKKMYFFDFNPEININKLYYIFLYVFESEILIIKKDKHVWEHNDWNQVYNYFHITFHIWYIIIHIFDIVYMTFNLIIEYQTQKSDVFDINSRNNYTKFFHFLREKVHPKT